MTISFHVQVKVGDKTRSFTFKRPAIKIGRKADNDLVLPDASVAEHAVTVALHDRNGGESFRMETPVGSSRELEDGASVWLGRYGLTFVSGEPPTERETAFVRHLQAHPADDQMRLVYADWLEENGRASAGEFIRAQLKLLTLSPSDAAFLATKDTLHRLSKEFPAYWRRTLARPEIENCGVRFEFQCPKQWAELTPTDDERQRHCGTCQRNVYYASTVDNARKLALAGECVVVDIARHRYDNDLKQELREYAMGGIVAPSTGHYFE